MTESGPTILFTPAPLEPVDSSGMGPAPVMLGACVLLCVLIALIVRRRGRGTDPHERAFRGLGRRMGLTRAQATRVRRYAGSMNMVSPVGVLMNRALLREALSAPSARS